MCGISGFCNLKADYLQREGYWNSVLIDMREAIARRGNDETGEWLARTVGLSHTRLSIRDLKTGRQPIVKNINGNDYVIAYNGEIYNTDELKNVLIKRGYVFKTTTDTEVILFLYIEYGEKCVDMLNGIFSFAIWDGGEERLALFRDRSGIKPLFYTIYNNTLVFGSEIKALFKFPEVKAETDLNSFREIIGIGPARTAGNGVFKNIFEVKPGCFAVFSQGGFKEYEYWSLVSRPHKESYEETVAHTAFLLKDAVEKQMVSDVPVCTFLSGGIDSSVVTALATNFLKKEGKKLNTFSFDFSKNDIYFKSNSFQPEQDRPYVDKMLDVYDVNHTYLMCDEKDLAELLKDSTEAKDLPGMADIDASLLYFCRLVKERNKVALTGECADEIFGGYPWFHKKEAFESSTFPWSMDLQARTFLFNENFIKKLELKDYIDARYKESIQKVPILEGESKEEKRRREISFLNQKWFMTTLLDRMDRTSMYSGLEARVPFADHRIIEYIWNVPWEFKCRNGVVKGLLRDACKGLLPDELLWRKKSPYPKTYNPEYENILKNKIREILDDKNSPVLPIIDKDKVLEFIKLPSNYGKPFFGQLMAGPQTLAYIIQINYWLKIYNCEVCFN